MKFTRLSPEVYARQSRSGMRTDMTARAAYVSDASIYRRVPAAVLEPRTVAEIRDALAVAREKHWSVVARGGGTSVAGNAIGEGLLIDTSRHFHRILEIDPDNRTATVEPGVVCDHLREAAAEYGLTYGPDPSTHSRATIGGMVANNACGSHSVAWGTAADNLVELTMMLADGREITLRAGGCDEEEINTALRALRERHAERIGAELGRFSRQVSGYGLHHLLPENGFDVAKAVAGSEGTLGIITRLKVKLVEAPAHTALVVLAFDSIITAARVAPALRLPQVTTIEGMGGDLLAALRGKIGQETAGADLPGNRQGTAAGGWLYCEVGAASPAAALAAAKQVAAAVESTDHVLVDDPARMRQLWRIREAAAGIVTRLPDGGEAWPSWEDSAVPAEHLADYLNDLYALMAEFEYQGIPFGHFGEGCVHVRISFEFDTPAAVAKFERFMTRAAALVASYGGSLSGEHGDGRARSALLAQMYSREMRTAFEEFKLIFDPERRCNPGVLVWAEEITEGIRPRPGAKTLELRPVHALSRDQGSLHRAINRCIGVGSCRSEEAAMCPSFQITGDEVHSTRGRARILSEMLRGEILPDGFSSREAHEALDLCLSCRACASECPVNVDMSTYKAEFLHHFHRGRLRPRSHYLMGWLPLLSRLLHRIPVLPRLVDRAMHTPGVAQVITRLGGLDPGRALIHLAERSLVSWFQRRDAPTAASSTETVVLWPDTFNNHLSTGPAKAAVKVLEQLGFRVEIPTGFVCCGLTWHSTGQLAMTKRVLAQTAKTMQPYLDRDLPVVVLEPSCAAMLSHEATELSGEPELRRLQAQTRSFASVIAPKIAELVAEGGLPPHGLQALTQVHCHERALGDATSTQHILAALGITEEQIATGCCGLAGNWGFEPGHAEMSFALGERELFPRARRHAAAGQPVIADGFSCRTQIEQGTGQQAKHLAEVIAEVLGITDVAE